MYFTVELDSHRETTWFAGVTDYPPAAFKFGWTGDYSLLIWVTMANSVSNMLSPQVVLTSPMIRAPFKKYTISLRAP